MKPWTKFLHTFLAIFITSSLQIVLCKLLMFLWFFWRNFRTFWVVLIVYLHSRWRHFKKFWIKFTASIVMLYFFAVKVSMVPQLKFVSESWENVGTALCGLFFKKATSFFNYLISFSKFSFACFWFTSPGFDVDKVEDLIFLYWLLPCLLVWSFWASDILILVFSIFVLLTFLSMCCLASEGC